MKGYNFSFMNIYFINKPVFWCFKISSMSTELHSSFSLQKFNHLLFLWKTLPICILFKLLYLTKKYNIGKEYILRIRPPTLLISWVLARVCSCAENVSLHIVNSIHYLQTNEFENATMWVLIMQRSPTAFHNHKKEINSR